MLTKEQIDMNAHIPTEEVLQDIVDTQAEIVTLQREETALRMLGDRMSDFRADARRTGIAEREAFIAKLRELLDARQTKATP